MVGPEPWLWGEPLLWPRRVWALLRGPGQGVVLTGLWAAPGPASARRSRPLPCSAPSTATTPRARSPTCSARPWASPPPRWTAPSGPEGPRGRGAGGLGSGGRGGLRSHPRPSLLGRPQWHEAMPFPCSFSSCWQEPSRTCVAVWPRQEVLGDTGCLSCAPLSSGAEPTLSTLSRDEGGQKLSVSSGPGRGGHREPDSSFVPRSTKKPHGMCSQRSSPGSPCILWGP